MRYGTLSQSDQQLFDSIENADTSMEEVKDRFIEALKKRFNVPSGQDVIINDRGDLVSADEEPGSGEIVGQVSQQVLGVMKTIRTMPASPIRSELKKSWWATVKNDLGLDDDVTYKVGLDSGNVRIK